jgi:hypothetical protein
LKLRAEERRRARCLSKAALDEMDGRIIARIEEERSERARTNTLTPGDIYILEGRKVQRAEEARRVAADAPPKPRDHTIFSLLFPTF